MTENTELEASVEPMKSIDYDVLIDILKKIKLKNQDDISQIKTQLRICKHHTLLKKV